MRGYINSLLASRIITVYGYTQGGGGGGGGSGSTPRSFCWGGGGVWLGSPNPDPICDQNMPFAGTVFQTRPLKFIPIFKARLS